MAVTRATTTPARSTTAAAPGAPGAAPGFADGAQVTVKGQRASAAQLAVISGCLGEAVRLGASRRVLVAVVMCITQESNATALNHGDNAGPDSRGPFQQRDPWGPLAQRMDPAGSTRLFLTVAKGPGVNGWKAVHGSLNNAPGNLSRAINDVQRSAYPDAYAQWQTEAEATVSAYNGAAGADGGAASGRYEFTRGSQDGEPESSWEATGRLAEEVGWWRWAAGNVLYFVSPEELRQAQPSLTIRGTEPWLERLPAYEWAAAREVTECELGVLIGSWGVMVGAVVVLDVGGPLDGRWLVKSVTGERLDAPVATVTLQRPTLRLPEPAAEAAGGDGGSSSGSGDLMAVMEAASGKHPYVFGGGHGPALSSIKDGDGLDCSSSTALVLHRAGHYSQSTAMDSGSFAASWGNAGEGEEWTVWANAEHVFIMARDGSWRWDTSPQGDGGRGAHLRRSSRSTAGFTPRHAA